MILEPSTARLLFICLELIQITKWHDTVAFIGTVYHAIIMDMTTFRPTLCSITHPHYLMIIITTTMTI